MKKLLFQTHFLILISLIGSLFLMPQNDKLTGLTVNSVELINIYRHLPTTYEILLVKRENKIKMVIDFVKSVDFQPAEIDEIKKKFYLFRIRFKGWSDNIYFGTDFAFIGKSSFKIKEEVITDFIKLYRKLHLPL